LGKGTRELEGEMHDAAFVETKKGVIGISFNTIHVISNTYEHNN